MHLQVNLEEVMGSFGITNSITPSARLDLLMKSRIFLSLLAVECFVVSSCFVLQIKCLCVLLFISIISD